MSLSGTFQVGLPIEAQETQSKETLQALCDEFVDRKFVINFPSSSPLSSPSFFFLFSSPSHLFSVLCSPCITRPGLPPPVQFPYLSLSDYTSFKPSPVNPFVGLHSPLLEGLTCQDNGSES